jgi:hypothetical protein
MLDIVLNVRDSGEHHELMANVIKLLQKCGTSLGIDAVERGVHGVNTHEMMGVTGR